MFIAKPTISQREKEKKTNLDFMVLYRWKIFLQAYSCRIIRKNQYPISRKKVVLMAKVTKYIEVYERYMVALPWTSEMITVDKSKKESRKEGLIWVN